MGMHVTGFVLMGLFLSHGRAGLFQAGRGGGGMINDGCKTGAAR